jgi:hypothetical protein
MRYQCMHSLLATVLLVAFCAIISPAHAQDGPPRGGRGRDSDRERDGDFRPPSRGDRDSGPDRFEGSRSSEERRFDRGGGVQAREDRGRPAGRRPASSQRDAPSRGPRGGSDDAWSELAMRMRRPAGGDRPQISSRGPRGFGAMGPPGFAGGISSRVGGGSRGGGGFGGPPTRRPSSDSIADELRELNGKLDRLISALERRSQR